MNQKKATQLLRVIVILSLLLIAGGFLLRKMKPELYLEGKNYSPEEKARVLRDMLDELEVINNDPAAVQANERGVLTWPQASSIPEYHKTNLSIFSGRAKNKQALEGITVYLDAGEKEEIAAPAAAQTSAGGNGIRAAATDPYTGRLLPRYNQETMETRVEETPAIPRDQILEQLALLLKAKLEDMGAKVILTREMTGSGSDISQAAVLAEDLSRRFLEELEQQKFKCTPLSEVLPTIVQAKNTPADAQVSALYTANGVSPAYRLLLDVQRQYSEVLFLSLRMYQGGEKESGSRVIYFADGAAKGIGAARLSPDRPSDQPAYLAYNGTSRRRLAELIYSNIKGLLVDLSYQGNKSAVAEEAQITGRLSNVTTVEIQIGNEKSESNLKALSQEELLKSLAEAIATSCYRYYSD